MNHFKVDNDLLVKQQIQKSTLIFEFNFIILIFFNCLLILPRLHCFMLGYFNLSKKKSQILIQNIKLLLYLSKNKINKIIVFNYRS